MPIQHAVLALLAEGDSYGYELKQSFEEAIGPQWGELNIGHLYQVLDRLLRDGLATRRRVRQTERPDRAVYQLTAEGREELEHWLATPFVRQAGYRDDFFLKLFAASRLGPAYVKRVTRAQREAYLAELAALDKLRVQHQDSPLVMLLIEAAALHTDANLKIVELAEALPARRSATQKAPRAAAAGTSDASEPQEARRGPRSG
jgi:DNA-binding PadR family transcriptional regulator